MRLVALVVAAAITGASQRTHRAELVALLERLP
jgi:hypothetical protein